jgi:hypothetical protein
VNMQPEQGAFIVTSPRRVGLCVTHSDISLILWLVRSYLLLSIKQAYQTSAAWSLLTLAHAKPQQD